MIFRPATLEDADAIFILVCRMVEDTAFTQPTLGKVQRIIKNNYLECALLDGVMAGFMAGHVAETFLNNEKNAYDNGLFVAPEFRGKPIAVRLIKNFEVWAKAQGAKTIWLSQSVGQNKEKTLHFFERLGYSCQGFTTCKKL
jgi:GNAT superfamily N-acetyltransferase